MKRSVRSPRFPRSPIGHPGYAPRLIVTNFDSQYWSGGLADVTVTLVSSGEVDLVALHRLVGKTVTIAPVKEARRG